MKVKREDQVKQLATEMTRRLANNTDALYDKVIRDFETMGDMQLAGVAKDLGVDFEEDEPEEKWTYTCPNCGEHSFNCNMMGSGSITDHGKIGFDFEINQHTAVSPAHESDTQVDCNACGWNGLLRDIELT